MLRFADALHGVGNWLTFAVHVTLNGPASKVYISPVSETMVPLMPAVPVHVYVGLYPFAVQVNSSPASNVTVDGVMVTAVGQPADNSCVHITLASQSSVSSGLK